MTEKWLFIKESRKLYLISNYGRVKSLHYGKERILKPGANRDGYLRVYLKINKKLKYFSVHRLVAEYFIPNKENKETVNHKDGNKKNNNIKNLEWLSFKENIRHAFEHGLHKRKRGKDHFNTKLTEEMYLDIKCLLKTTKITQKELAILFNVSTSTISRIKRNKQWKN